MPVGHVDRLDAKPLQRRVTRPTDVVGRAIDPKPRSILGANVSELRCDHNLTAPVANGATDETLVRERAVGVRRIKKIDTQIQRATDRRIDSASSCSP